MKISWLIGLDEPLYQLFVGQCCIHAINKSDWLLIHYSHGRVGRYRSSYLPYSADKSICLTKGRQGEIRVVDKWLGFVDKPPGFVHENVLFERV